MLQVWLDQILNAIDDIIRRHNFTNKILLKKMGGRWRGNNLWKFLKNRSVKRIIELSHMICKPFRSQISRGDWTHFYLEKKNSNKCLLVHRQHTVTLWPDMHKKSLNFQTNRPINQPPPPALLCDYILSYDFFPCLLLIFFNLEQKIVNHWRRHKIVSHW